MTQKELPKFSIMKVVGASIYGLTPDGDLFKRDLGSELWARLQEWPEFIGKDLK